MGCKQSNINQVVDQNVVIIQAVKETKQNENEQAKDNCQQQQENQEYHEQQDQLKKEDQEELEKRQQLEEEEKRKQAEEEQRIQKEREKLAYGDVEIRFNKWRHEYDSLFAIYNFKTNYNQIDEYFDLKNVQDPGYSFYLVVEKDGQIDESQKYIAKGKIGEKYFMNLVPGTTYRLVCVKGKPIIWGENPKDDKNRKEGCSCIYGNPCEDPYVCEDWENRWDVAKKNGYKG